MPPLMRDKSNSHSQKCHMAHRLFVCRILNVGIPPTQCRMVNVTMYVGQYMECAYAQMAVRIAFTRHMPALAPPFSPFLRYAFDYSLRFSLELRCHAACCRHAFAVAVAAAMTSAYAADLRAFRHAAAADFQPHILRFRYMSLC